MKKGNDKLTISVNKEIKDKYKEFCEEEGFKIGKKIEKFMEEELKKVGKGGGK
tara:strand:- start:975 stop:1133 length:159 start_codon:yes stop_codon:yes gene_type:complete